MLDIIARKIQTILPKKKLKINALTQNFLLHSSLPYYVLTLLMIIAQFQGIQSSFFFIWIVYAIFPLLDEFINLDLKNPNKQDLIKLQKNDIYFKFALYFAILFDWLLFFKFMNLISEMTISLSNIVYLIGLLFIFSNLNAVQFAVSHQIFHKLGNFHKYLGTIHMIKNLYMHFTYQHLYGHHKRVATPQDPASARKGQNLYNFLPKTFFGSYKSVYQMQLKQKKSFFLNYSVLSVISSLLFTLAVFSYFGTMAGLFFVIQAYGSIIYLQSINYIQHYGLQRSKLDNGQYQKVTIRHSWNAPHRFTNYLLFKLQRHSDHHQNSLKPYQTLLTLQQSPHLPHGYTVCIFMSYFPQTWKRIMDPLVDQYKRVKFGNINRQIIKKSILQTRIFIIKTFIITSILLIISIVL